MGQRATELATRPVRAKTNRADTPASSRSEATAELDESKFGSLTADLCLRKGDPQAFTLASLESSKAGQGESEFASSTAELLVDKGAAAPSVIEAPHAEANAQPDSIAARDQDDGELFGLRDQLAALEAALADRDAESAQMLAAAEQARETLAQEAQDALRMAEEAWKADEAARLAAAQAQWQEQTISTLAEAHAQAEASCNQAEEELRRLRDECAAIQATLTDRDAELVETRLARDQAREQWQLDSEAALSSARAAFEADEAAHLAAAEAHWWKQSADAIAQATARYDAAEAALTQVRMEASRERSDAVGGNVFHKQAGLQAKRASRETGLAPVRSAEERGQRTTGSKIVIRTNRMRDAIEATEQEPRAPRRRAVRDVFLAAAVTVLAIVIYPSIEPLLPETWRSNIAAVTGGIGPVVGHSPAPLESLPETSPSVAVQHFAVVVRDVNVRASPSTTATVISMLPRGLKVATIEQRENWTLVQIEGDSRNPKPRQGWVYGSYLKAGGNDDAVPPSAKPK